MKFIQVRVRLLESSSLIQIVSPLGQFLGFLFSVSGRSDFQQTVGEGPKLKGAHSQVTLLFARRGVAAAEPPIVACIARSVSALFLVFFALFLMLAVRFGSLRWRGYEIGVWSGNLVV
jgi:hypothetical protein